MFRKELKILLVLFALFLNNNAQAQDGSMPVEPSDSGRPVVVSTEVKANPELVWFGIHEARMHDPALKYGRVVSQDGNQTVFEERLEAPLLGDTTNIFACSETANRLDYHLMSSNKFRQMEGSWVVEKSPTSGETKVTLSCSAHLKKSMLEFVLRPVLVHRLEKRLQLVKEISERKQVALSQDRSSVTD